MEENKLQPQAEEQVSRLPALRRRTEVGRAGEEAAAAQILELGYRIVERNWRCRKGEIDLIAIEDAVLVFVEVRSRTNPTRYGSAVEAVTPRKCRQVRELATIYLKSFMDQPSAVRFDVIAVTFTRDGVVAEIKHIQGAF